MKHRNVILLFLFFQIFTLTGQISEEIKNSNTDSLRQVLSTLTDTEKIDTLNKIAFRVTKDYPDSCRKLAIQTISLSDSLDYKKGLADGFQNLGESYYVLDNLFQAMINYLKAVRIYEQIHPSIELSNIYQRLAYFNIFIRKDKSAIDYLLKSNEVLKAISITRSVKIYGNYHNIAYSYMLMGKYDSAFFYNEIASKYTDSSTFYRSCNNYGLIYGNQFLETGDTFLLDKSIEWFLRGLSSPEIDNP